MQDWFNKNKGWFIPVAVIALIAVIGWGMVNGIRNEAITRETQLSTEYLANQNHLSSYISEFKETVGIADRKTEQLDRVMTDAIQGRYGDVSANNGQFFTALKEAYPNLSGLDIYDKVVETIRTGRSDFKNRQDGFLDKLRGYDTWRKQGIIRSMALGTWAPSQNLVARVNGQQLTGKAALDQMYKIVLIDDVNKIYQSGSMDALAAPPLPDRK